MFGAMLMRCAASDWVPAMSSIPPSGRTRAGHELPRIGPPVEIQGKGVTLHLELEIDVHQDRRLGLLEDHAVAHLPDHHPAKRTLASAAAHVARPIIDYLSGTSALDSHDVVPAVDRTARVTLTALLLVTA